MNQYEITKSNRYGYGNVWSPQYRGSASVVGGLSEPSGRFGCMVVGTRPDPGTNEESYCAVYSAANKAANSFFPYAPLSESYEYGDISSLFNYYVSGVRANAIPEYYPYKNEKGVIVNKYNMGAVIKWLQERIPALKKYAKPDEFINYMFYHAANLYNQDMTNFRPDLLWPLTVDSRDPGQPVMVEYFKRKLGEIKEESDKGTGIVSGVNDLLSNVLTVIVIGTAIYFLAPIIFSRR